MMISKSLANLATYIEKEKSICFFFYGIFLQGHFGEVKRAEYQNRQVAVKILRVSRKDLSKKEFDSFVNEALLLRRYKHKHIVEFIGVASYRDPLMIVMELAERRFRPQFFFISNFSSVSFTRWKLR